VIVTAVSPGSAAEDAGLKRNDMIKEVNRVAVHSAKEFRNAIEGTGKEGSVALLVRRGENTFYVALQMG
jgi:S1-C subfamily serine protease